MNKFQEYPCMVSNLFFNVFLFSIMTLPFSAEVMEIVRTVASTVFLKYFLKIVINQHRT